MFLGLDFGTSSVKGVIIDDKQKLIATASSPLKVSRPHPGWSEQNPEDWWKAANAVVKALRKQKPKAIAAVKGIGMSGQQHGATLLDKNGKVLRPCILWNDARSFAECEDILRDCPEAPAITGNVPLAGFTAPKLVWVRKHERKIFDQVAKVLLPKDYIRFRMTGTYGSDMSDSAGSYWLDVAKRDWSETVLKATHMRRDQMPELFEGTDATGRISDKLAKDWGMPLKPVVAGGGGDNASAAVGIGAVHDGDAILSLGTSGVLFVANKNFSPNTERRVHAFCHAVPGQWHQMGVILSATDSIEWLARLLKTPAPKLTAALGKKLDGPSSVLLLPYFSGERTPVGDSQIRGAMLGLSHESTASELTHAVLDGVAFAFRDCLEALRQAGTDVKRVTAVGGGTHSEIWLKIIATVLGIPIDLPAAGDVGGAFGGARMGMMAATGASYEKVCTKPKIAKTILPEKQAKAAYDAAYQRYTKIYPNIKDIR
ncbi:xylulokinase [Aestuariivirga litoralis]|uniref:xylulokinase n=1 Tax=Aestuariivirga litoralis TaxID=2650924 RepID=UPI0018C54B7C|nr:xylulokinase [Aestuariivirga litoralis]MBG1232851.1 xylulokinase [Aestuariivirga litoralis]